MKIQKCFFGRNTRTDAVFKHNNKFYWEILKSYQSGEGSAFYGLRLIPYEKDLISLLKYFELREWQAEEILNWLGVEFDENKWRNSIAEQNTIQLSIPFDTGDKNQFKANESSDYEFI